MRFHPQIFLRKGAFFLAAALFLITACDQRAAESQSASVPMQRAGSPAMEPAPSNLGMEQGQAKRYMAVSHYYSLRLPLADIKPVFESHILTCEKIGCIILSSQMQNYGEGHIFASFEARIPQQSFSSFIDTLTADPVTVLTHNQTAEDKTLPILDIEKRLEAKSALRDRLESMLREHKTESLADLLAVERELAVVQGDIESAKAQRNFLLSETSTIKLSVRYDVTQTGVSSSSALGRALDRFGGNIEDSTAYLVETTAVLLPWAGALFVFLLVVRLLLWRRRSVRAKK